MPATSCPSCLASLHTPDNVPDGRRVKCPKCGLSFKLSRPPAAPPASSKDFWEKAKLDSAIDAAVPPPPAQPAKAKPSPQSKSPAPIKPLRNEASPTTVPRGSRPPIIIAAAAVGLSIGLGVALFVALNNRNPAETTVASNSPPQEPAAPKVDPEATAVVDAAKALPLKDEPKAPPPAVPPPAPAKPPDWALENWQQDIGAARRVAVDQSKDLLILFNASDWANNSKALFDEVLSRPEYRKRLADRFVPVHIDFPKYPTAERRVLDPARNARLQARYFRNPAYPRTILADPDGRPYATREGYKVGQPEQYVADLEKAVQTRVERDVVLKAIGQADGKARLAAARKALDYLVSQIEGPSHRGDGTYVLNLGEFYGQSLREWRDLAAAIDPENADAQREWFFWHDWARRVDRALADKSAPASTLSSLADELTVLTSSGCKLTGSSCAMSLYSKQAELFGRLNDGSGRKKAIDAAMALNPSPEWRRRLNSMQGRPEAERGFGTGTGFAVAPGYVVTNHHVIAGAQSVHVRLDGPGRQPLPATVVARDEIRDLALLKVDLPVVTKLPAVRISTRTVADAGTDVGTVGYALGASETKFTKGSISQKANWPNGVPILVLDMRVNPGNSGGPLFDSCGNVVGIVTFKLLATDVRLDSYGVAVAASPLDTFLREHLKQGYAAQPPLTRKLDWPELRKATLKSVVEVIAESK